MYEFMVRKVQYDEFSLTPEHKYQEALCHSTATAQGCCLEIVHSRSTFL